MSNNLASKAAAFAIVEFHDFGGVVFEKDKGGELFREAVLAFAKEWHIKNNVEVDKND
jgi:hypothetical protein